MKYNSAKIELKWQKKWMQEKLFAAKDFDSRPKKYFLVEFPYPSGDGLHVGHVRGYTALDILSRKKRMEGFNVLYPIGWDAFGLPTENYALKTGLHPTKVTEKNIKVFKKQLQSLGLYFDWSREINTTDPNYYQWTQWIFLKFFAKGLAYQSAMPINWCPSCKIGLANEEVVDGKCERCGTETERRKIKQWMLKITQYADRLIDDLKQVDYLEKIKTQQINWIGRSEGTEIKFLVKNSNFQINVFTTRVDTIFGVTALVVAPEHELVSSLRAQISNFEEVEEYIKIAKRKSDLERTDLTKEKTGVELKGLKAINPANNQEVSIWLADYVVASYGGGAVMMVPAHDKRDYQFAKKYNLLIKEVISGGDISKEAYVEYGKLINSGEFNGLTSEKAVEKITDWLTKKNLGKKIIHYKLRDWIFSRQHYWGEPIPIIHCQKCGAVAVPEKDLPVKLPFVKKYQPSGTGESPLAKIEKWVKTKCPKCGGPAQRETDTMPNWAGSNWYYLRYLDPKNKKALADRKKINYWMPVDWYNGGMEHTTLHLLYSRFVYKFLFDLGLVSQNEPYQKRTAHGMILAENGQKMSKSRGNVINPDAIVKNYGADALRLYEMFMGPFDQAIAWSTQGLIGCFRFLNRLWDLFNDQQKFGSSSKEIKINLHQLIKKVSEDIEAMKFNTAIAAMMEFVNFWSQSEEKLEKKEAGMLLKIMAPFIPHLSEELYQSQSGCCLNSSVFLDEWPKPEADFLVKKEIEFIVQINGKVRDTFKIGLNLTEEEIKKISFDREKIKKYLADQKIKKIIFVPNKLINFVI